MTSEKTGARSVTRAVVLAVVGIGLVAATLLLGYRLGASSAPSSAIAVSQAPREDEAPRVDVPPGAPAAPSAGGTARSLPSLPVDPSELSAGQPKALNATTERDQQVAELVRSGPDTANQAARLEDVNREWVAMATELGLDVKITPWRCHRAGCYATISDIEPGKVEALGSRFAESRGFLSWPGGKFRSGPIPSKDGHVQVTWAFFADDQDGAPGGAASAAN